MNQFQIFSRPRHLRYMFFIDINYAHDKLLKLINDNQKIWGGRYNPIIPVKDGEIVEDYLKVIKNYDPDYIFYSNKVNPEVIERLCFFNPTGYVNLDEIPKKEDILGVNALYFVSQFENTSSILTPENTWKTNSVLLDYYLTNFGLGSNGYVGEDKITKNLIPIKITVDNFFTLNQIIHDHKPINRAELSKRNLNTKILRNLQFARYNSFEIVIAKDTTSIQDLLYYWNRELYQCHNIIYLTVEELVELTKDTYFGGVLYDLSIDQTIDVVSLTFTKEEVEKLINDHLNNIAFHRTFRYQDRLNFPFDVLDADGLFERDYGEQPSLQTLLSEENLLFIPQLSFTEKVDFYPQKWAMDIQISQISKPSQKLINFPLTTDTRFIVS